MKHTLQIYLSLIFLLVVPAFAQTARDPAKDRQALTELEQEWLHAHDAATLDRILASDFVHVIPFDHFLSKQENIDWAVKHPEPKNRHTKFGKLKVRLYGDVGIVNGSVVATKTAKSKRTTSRQRGKATARGQSSGKKAAGPVSGRSSRSSRGGGSRKRAA